MDQSPGNEEPLYPSLNVSAGRKLLRFALAGIAALVIAFATLLFMTFLVNGLDDTASNTLTRYISLPSMTIHRRAEEEFRPIKPQLQPEIEVADESDIGAEALLAEDAVLSLGETGKLQGKIETDISLPGLAEVPLQERDKMRQIKEALISEEER